MFVDNGVTRLPGGITNVNVGDIFNSLKGPDPTLFSSFLDDFYDFVPTAWTVTETQAGATQATAAGNYGILALVNSAADNDVNQIQKAAISVLPVAGKKLFMKCKFSLSDATQSDFAIGFATISADATVLANSLDGIFWLKADDAATVTLYVRQDNTTGSVNSGAIATLANATLIELACFFDGQDRVYYAVNGAVGGFITVSSATLPNAAGAPVISLKNGDANARTANVDYLFIAQER